MVFASSRDIDPAQAKFQDGVPSEFYLKRGWIHCKVGLFWLKMSQKP